MVQVRVRFFLRKRVLGLVLVPLLMNSHLEAAGCKAKVKALAARGLKTFLWTAAGITTLTGGVVGTAVLTTESSVVSNTNLSDPAAIRVNLIGDSLSKPFYVSNDLGMMWRIWTKHQGTMLSETFFERLSSREKVIATNYAKVGAGVNSPKRLFEMASIGAEGMAGQVSAILESPNSPDLVLLFMGHNDMDWVQGLSDSQRADSQFAEFHRNQIRSNFISTYEFQLNRLVNRARDRAANGKKTSIVVYGLINFESFFEARDEAEEIRKRSPGEYPYLEKDYTIFESMKPEYRAGMIELARDSNRELAELVARIQSRLSADRLDHLIFVHYSDALSSFKLEGAAALSSIDAWHPSAQGIRAMGEELYKGATPAIEFLKSEIPND